MLHSNTIQYSETPLINSEIPPDLVGTTTPGPGQSETQSLTNIYISEEDLMCQLQNLELNMSAGPDSIPGILLRKCSESLVYPLTKFSQTKGSFHYTSIKARV